MFEFFCILVMVDSLSVWLSGNALVSINVVTVRWARLVPGWVNVLGWVNCLSAEPGILVYSAYLHGSASCNEYSTTGTSRDTLACICGLAM